MSVLYVDVFCLYIRRQFFLCHFDSSLPVYHSTVFSGEGTASIKHLDALVTSCVVVPCSFTHPNENMSTSRLRWIWKHSQDQNQLIYSENNTTVSENFTRLLGQLDQNNCTLQISEVTDNDYGSYCFQSSTSTTDVTSCAELNILCMSPTFQDVLTPHHFYVLLCLAFNFLSFLIHS